MQTYLLVLCLCLLSCTPYAQALAAPPSYDLTNAEPAKQVTTWLLRLPNGQNIDPWTVLPEGWIALDDDSLLTGEGLILRKDGSIEYPLATDPKALPKKETIVTEEGFTLLPVSKEDLAQGKMQTSYYPQGTVLKRDGRLALPEKPNTPASREKPELWSMLPLTDVKEERRQKAQTEPPKRARIQSGENLRIPENAGKNGDLSFLEGCWVSDPITGGTWDDPKKAKTTSVCTMCFNKQGKGQLTVSSGSLRCRGAARAHFTGKALKIDSDNAKCPSNPANIAYFTYRDWKCTGTNRATQCFLLSINPKKRHEVSQFKTHLKKK
ncbi:MAG: hypothetical protein J5846_00735 [Desulfovibrio sp.]|nr:hypothetical protein [Desulfovibrio sp.]